MKTIAGLNPTFVQDAISALMIRGGYKDLADSALEKAIDILEASRK